MDCYEAMRARRRLYREGKINLTRYDQDAEQDHEDREYINDDLEEARHVERMKSDADANKAT